MKFLKCCVCKRTIIEDHVVELNLVTLQDSQVTDRTLTGYAHVECLSSVAPKIALEHLKNLKAG